MSTIYIWVLIIWSSGDPFVIDNISSKEECQRVAGVFKDRYNRIRTQCVEVQKVKL